MATTRRLKLYGVGNHGFIRPHLNELLGLPFHVRQATVLIATPTKKRAVELLETNAHVSGPRSVRDPELQLIEHDHDLLRWADGRERVFAHPMSSSHGPILDITDAEARVIGELAPRGEHTFYGQ